MKCVAKIKEAHSLKGELYAFIFSQDLAWIEDLESLSLSRLDENRQQVGDFTKFKIISFKAHKKGMILKLEGIKDRTEAEKWEGFGVFIDEEDLVSESGETIYLGEILGFDLIDQNDKSIGPVEDFRSNGTQDLLVVTVNGQEFLVPFVEDFITEIDFENRKLYMNLPEGLFE